MIKCSKCGTECSDKALFCSSCGKSLADERGDNKTYKCSKCGATFKGKKAFCENCGTKFVWQDKPEEIKEEVKPASVTPEVQKQSTATKVMNIITYSISFVVIILSMTAIWLDFGKLEAKLLPSSTPDTFGISIFFDEMWKQDSYTMTYFPGFIMFIVAIVLTFTFSITAIVKQIKSGIKKEFKVSTTALSFVAIPPLIFQILSYSVFYIKETATYIGDVKTVLGPGPILSIISVAILFVVIVLYNIFNNIKSSSEIVSSIFKYIVSVIFVFAGVFMFVETRTMSNTSGQAVTNINMLISLEYSTAKRTSPEWATMVLEMVIQVTAVLFLFATALCSFISINDKKYNKARVTLGSISLAFIIGFIVCFFAGNKNVTKLVGTEFDLGSCVIVGLILFLLAFGLSIATAALDSKQEA